MISLTHKLINTDRDYAHYEHRRLPRLHGVAISLYDRNRQAPNHCRSLSRLLPLGWGYLWERQYQYRRVDARSLVQSHESPLPAVAKLVGNVQQYFALAAMKGMRASGDFRYLEQMYVYQQHPDSLEEQGQRLTTGRCLVALRDIELLSNIQSICIGNIVDPSKSF